MKKLLVSIIACFSLLFSGCKTAPTPGQLATITLISQDVSSVGTQAALIQNPDYRPAFNLAYAALDKLVVSGGLTGASLQQILSALPIKELRSSRGSLEIAGAVTLFDLIAGSKVVTTSQPYALAVGTGIRDGWKIALGK